jgi:hypothetical protein
MAPTVYPAESAGRRGSGVQKSRLPCGPPVCVYLRVLPRSCRPASRVSRRLSVIERQKDKERDAWVRQRKEDALHFLGTLWYREVQAYSVVYHPR